MCLVHILGAKPSLSMGSVLTGTASDRQPAAEATVNAFKTNLKDAKTLEEVMFLMRFFSDEGYGLVGYSQDRVYHLGVLSTVVQSLDKSIKDLPSNVVFMWNLFPRTGGLRKRIMQLSNCDDKLIKRYC